MTYPLCTPDTEPQTASDARMRLIELIASIEQTIAEHGYRFGVDRRHEVSLPMEVRKRAAAQITRDWESGLSDGRLSADVSRRVQRLADAGHYFRLVDVALQALRDAGKFVVRDYREPSKTFQGAFDEKA